MLRLQVKDFGPICEGDVQLKPLTVFIGPNNSGKSYLAVLAYALLHSTYTNHEVFPFKGGIAYGFLRYKGIRAPGLLRRYDPVEIQQESLTSFEEWFDQHAEQISKDKFEVKIAELPKPVTQTLEKIGSHFIQKDSFSEELQRCYSSKIADLIRKDSSVKNFHISLQHELPNWKFAFHSNNSKLDEEKSVDISSLSFPVQLIRFSRHMRETSIGFSRHMKETSAVPFRHFIGEFYHHLYKDVPKNICYLPAARSGILQSHKLLAGYIVSHSPLVGIESIEIPKLSGVVADFISGLISLEKERKHDAIYKVAQLLARDVAKGDIDINVGKVEYPEIYYKQPNVGKFSLHRTSSMVSELAPIVLFLKYSIRPGDFLIIEEPESHLHPASQRSLARVLVKLLRVGVKILITTHSDYLLGELNNFIRLSQTSEDVREKKGYSKDDYLKSDEVGSYLFELHPQKGGSIVKELEVTPEDGILEEEFVKVAEALGNEAASLDRLISQRIL